MGEVICNCKLEIESIKKDVAAIKQMHDGLSSAFPAGDTKGHHDYHVALIERNKELRRLRMAIVEKTISALLWSFILWCGVGLWRHLVATFYK